MQKIKMKISDGKITIDFEGFAGNDCQLAEDKIRLILARMGVKTNVEYSDNKRGATTNGIAERERN